jgi:metal-responsive CopG/Arc/MetJ family transcriptional regulator
MKDTTKINITLPTNLLTKIETGNYNRNKLIVDLFKKYIDNKQK